MDEAQAAQEQLIAKRLALGLNPQGVRPGVTPLKEALKNALAMMPSPSKESLTTVCPQCGVTLEPVQQELLGVVRWRPTECPVCAPKIRTADEQRKTLTELEKRFDRYRWAFPFDANPALASVTLDQFKERKGAENALRMARQYADSLPKPNPPGLVLWGVPGNGKSHLSAAITQIAYSKLMAVAWIHTPTWLRTLGSLTDNARREDLILMASRADLLVLEDLGGERLTGPRAEWLLSVIDAIYRHRRNIVVTTNLAMNALAKALTPMTQGQDEPNFLSGERIVDRLAEMALVVQNKASSYRIETAARRRKALESEDTA